MDINVVDYILDLCYENISCKRFERLRRYDSLELKVTGKDYRKAVK